jgi:hypothetical protein
MRPQSASPTVQRRWTRLGVVGIGAHVFYELVCGVGMPLASVAGPAPAAVSWAAGTTYAFRVTARDRKPPGDMAFALLNGLFLSAVLAHFAYWPKRYVKGVPWLTECEGLRGTVMAPYNLILYLSGIAAVGGLRESGRAALRGAVVPVVLVPLLVAIQHYEFKRLRTQALRRPAWWNRRLQVTARTAGRQGVAR